MSVIQEPDAIPEGVIRKTATGITRGVTDLEEQINPMQEQAISVNGRSVNAMLDSDTQITVARRVPKNRFKKC